MDNDWDRKPKESPSIWIKLKTQGEAAKVRIVTAPLREVNIYPSGEQRAKPMPEEITSNLTSGQWMSVMRSPYWEIRESYVLLVVDRLDGGAKIFRVSGTIYGKIRDYAKNPEWGTPLGYDITVTRTETPGKAYWDVTPSPKSQLMNSEVDKVKALNIANLLPNALPTNVPQPDEVDENTPPEKLPTAFGVQEDDPRTETENMNDRHTRTQETTPAVQLDEIVEVTDGPVNLDDIPFNTDQSTSKKGSESSDAKV